MQLTESDRRLLAAVGPNPQDPDVVADALDRPRDDLGERLAELAENGLVRDCGDGRYCRTESGRRLIRTASGRMDEAIDTTPAIEETLAGTGLAPDATDAVRGAFAFLRYWGEATADEIVDAIYPEWPAGHDSPDDWWDDVGEALESLPEIVPPEIDSIPSETSTPPALWRYTGTAETTTPDSDGFLSAGTRGHHRYGSVKHAIESLDLSATERDAVRAAFGELRRRGEAADADIVAALSPGDETANRVSDTGVGTLVETTFPELPGVSRVGDRWRYRLPPTD